MSGRWRLVGLLVSAMGVVHGCGSSSHRVQRRGAGSGGSTAGGMGGAAGAQRGGAPEAGAPGAGRSAGRGGAGGTSGTGGTGSARAGRGGSGLGGGGRGGVSGSLGGGGRGGVSGSLGGGGRVPDCSSVEDTAGEGGGLSACSEALIACCRDNTPWGDDHDYYAASTTGCGAPRTCPARVSVIDGCQDTYLESCQDTRCCSDGRWHLIDGAYQYVVVDSDTGQLAKSPLSPACGGRALGSGSALRLYGYDYLDLPMATHPEVGALELWFRTLEANGPLLSSASTTDTLFVSGGRVCFYPTSNGTLLCSPESGFADGAWHHAAFSAGLPDSNTGSLYVDGSLRASGPFIPHAVGDLRAGYGTIGASTTLTYFTGDVDEIRVWRAPRDPYEIIDYATTRFEDPAMLRQLVGYWPLEELGRARTAPNLAEDEPLPPLCLANAAGAGGEGGGGPSPHALLEPAPSYYEVWVYPGAF